jgi:hypothetical protein
LNYEDIFGNLFAEGTLCVACDEGFGALGAERAVSAWHQDSIGLRCHTNHTFFQLAVMLLQVVVLKGYHPVAGDLVQSLLRVLARFQLRRLRFFLNSVDIA